MTKMFNNNFDTILQAFLHVTIKHRDEKGLLYCVQTLAKTVTNDEFNDLINNYFLENMESLSDEDIYFYEDTANNFINGNTNIVEQSVSKVKKEKTTDMRKIKKAIELFEKNGLQLGLDYSFHNGQIRMKKESKDKIQKLLG